MPRSRKSRKVAQQTSEKPSIKRIPISSLPLELILSIMEQLNGSTSILKHCALVCRRWRLPAQRYLFSHMSLQDSDTCNQINRILRTSPHIATHVDTLTIHHNSSFMTLRNASRIIEKLCNVRTLRLLNNALREHWTANELENIFKLHSVETLLLEEDGDDTLIPRLLESFPNLRSFQLWRGDLRSPPALTHPHDGPLLQMPLLKSLALPNVELQSNSSIVEFFTRPEFDYSNLQSLKLYCQESQYTTEQDKNNLDPMDSLLKKCGQHVRTLTLVFPEHSQGDTLPAFFLSKKSISHFPMLRNLGLVTHIEHFALLSLAEGLRRLASPSIQHLQNITLDLFIWLHHSSPSLLMELSDLLEWKILDRRLSNPSYFADLMKLNVRLSLRVDISFLTLTHKRDDIKNLSREQLEGTIRKQFEGLFRACLPATGRSGKLGVEFRTILFDPTVKGLEHFSSWNEARPKTDLVSYAFDI